MKDTTWKEFGACASTDPELFFHPDDERGNDRKARANKAKAICAVCPVLLDCRSWVLESGEKYGTWGGLSEADRESVRRSRSRKTREQRAAEKRRYRARKAAERAA